MAKAVDVAARALSRDIGGLATLVRDAFRRRVGDDRFAVWFGSAAVFAIDAAAECLTVESGPGFQQEWLRRTFQADLDAATIEACGRKVRVVWRPGVTQPAVAPSHQATPRARRAAAAAAVTPPPAPAPAAGPGRRRLRHRRSG